MMELKLLLRQICVYTVKPVYTAPP